MFRKENNGNLQLFDGCQILFGGLMGLNNQINGVVYLADLYFEDRNVITRISRRVIANEATLRRKGNKSLLFTLGVNNHQLYK
jgi:hypothetical protein